MSQIPPIEAVKTGLRRPRLRLRTVAIVLLAEAILFSLGFAILLIVHGAASLILRLTLYWPPALSVLRPLLAGEQSSATSFRPVPLKGWRIPSFAITVAVRLFMVGFGVLWLVRVGFCGQNLICILLR